MTPAYAKEYKKYGIVRARRPQQHPCLAGVVLCLVPGGREKAYIRFSEELVDAVGAVLPYGVSPMHPAFLQIMHFAQRGVWRMFAIYLDRSKGVLLWEYQEQPSWLHFVEKKS